MNKGLKIAAVSAIVIIIAGAGFWYSKHRKPPAVVLSQKLGQLSGLILKDHDCPKVIEEAQIFVDKYPNSPEVWVTMGSCLFDLGKFDEAKVAFNKALAIDPNNKAAKNYLNQIGSSNGVVVAASQTPITQTEFEVKLGLKLSSLNFENAAASPSNVTEFITATYTTTNSFTKTVDYIKSELTKAKIKFSASTGTSQVSIIAVTQSEQKTFNIEKGDQKTKITIKYIKY